MRQLPRVLMVLVMLAVPAFSQTTTFTTNEQIPIASSLPFVFVPCAAGGAGEQVNLAGYLHVVSVVTIDATKGTILVKTNFQPMDVSGVGLATGDKYRGNGVSGGTFASTGAPVVTFTFINRFNIVGQGANNNFTVRETEHLTIRADGSTATTFDNFTVECK